MVVPWYIIVALIAAPIMRYAFILLVLYVVALLVYQLLPTDIQEDIDWLVVTLWRAIPAMAVFLWGCLLRKTWKDA